MSVDREDEAALRAALRPRGQMKQPKLMSARVAMHPEDWGALFYGLEQWTGQRGWARIQLRGESDHQTLDRDAFLARSGAHDTEDCTLWFCPQDANYDGRPITESGEGYMRAQSFKVISGGFFGDGACLSSAILTGHYYDDDKRKAAFLRAMKRCVRKISTGRVLEYEQDGTFRKVDESSYVQSYGLAALRWQTEASVRKVIGHVTARPHPDWEFPEQHPWYLRAGGDVPEKADRHERAALAAAVKQSTDPTQEKYGMRYPVLHPLDWAALFRGLAALAEAPVWALIRRERGAAREVLSPAEFIDALERQPFHECILLFGDRPEHCIAMTHMELRAHALAAPSVYCFGGEWRPQDGVLRATNIVVRRHAKDIAKAPFLEGVIDVIKQVSDNRYLSYYRTATPTLVTHDGMMRYGFAALRWKQQDPARKLGYDGAAEPGWQFPEDHPWYQDGV